MESYQYGILVAGWVVWVMPLFRMRPGTPVKVDRRARWGLLFQSAAYGLLWFGPFWADSPPDWRVALSAFFFLLGDVTFWTATHALGRQWRFDAGLIARHELVVWGPYGLVRHPIYASMLAMLLATGFMITPWLRFSVAVAIFLAGTEIRVRIEDSLLALRFGSQFTDYQRNVPAYIPMLR